MVERVRELLDLVELTELVVNLDELIDDVVLIERVVDRVLDVIDVVVMTGGSAEPDVNALNKTCRY